MRKSSHPQKELFGYINGDVDASRAGEVEDHLRRCSECNSFVELIAGLKSQVALSNQARGSDLKAPETHPTVAALADFFYSGTRRREASVAAHVAVCTDCANALSHYARGEAAAAGDPASQRQGEASIDSSTAVSEGAWEMIRDWEESEFARDKDDSGLGTGDLLRRLSELLAAHRDLFRRRALGEPPGLVAVAVIDNSGRMIGVELFKQVTGGLKHADDSELFDEKPVHALLDYGEGQRLVVSDRVRGNRIELRQAQLASTGPLRTDYFIVEE